MTAEEAKARNQSHHILVVDDEEIVLVALRETLRQLGYAVSTAPNAVQSLVFLQQHQFAAVITDYQMPHLTGLEFLAHVKMLQPDASRVLITAVLNLTTVIDAINRAEVFRFLIKPWRREDLVETLRAAVEHHQAAAHKNRQLAESLTTNERLVERVKELEAELTRRALH